MEENFNKVKYIKIFPLYDIILINLYIILIKRLQNKFRLKTKFKNKSVYLI
jgi:hypothetical protein